MKYCNEIDSAISPLATCSLIGLLGLVVTLSVGAMLYMLWKEIE